jgi:hypothetical protein
MVGRASEAAVADVGASFDERVQQSLELIAAGESVVALENLVENLYEYDVPLGPGDHDQLVRLVAEIHVGPGAQRTVPLLRASG